MFHSSSFHELRFRDINAAQQLRRLAIGRFKTRANVAALVEIERINLVHPRDGH